MDKKRAYTLTVFNILYGVFFYITCYAASVLLVSALNPFAFIAGFPFVLLAYYGTVFYIPTIRLLIHSIISGQTKELELHIRNQSGDRDTGDVNIFKDRLSKVVKYSLFYTSVFGCFALGLLYIVTFGEPSDSQVISFEVSRKILGWLFFVVTIFGAVKSWFSKK